MKSIKIYQTDNRNYRFESYDWATKKGLNINDYNLVAEFDDDDYDDNNAILNKLWDLGNNGTLQNTYRMRSISVSDIIEIDGIKYYVDDIGFKEVK